MDIGRKIQELRKVSGMTQEQLAEKLNISRQTVSKWETSSTLPDLESILKLCRIFHISLDDLLEEEKKLQSKEERITLEDLARINRHSRKITLLFISGLLFLMIAFTIISIILAVRSATLSTQYILYRYITVGEYAGSVANYSVLIVLAIIAAAVGVAFMVYCIVENKSVHNRKSLKKP